MSPAVSKVCSQVFKSMEAALGDPVVQGLVAEELVSSDPHRWTMHVKHGFLRKEVRYIRNPNWKPSISDMMYALQSRS